VMVLRKKSLPGFLAAVVRALLGVTRQDDMIRLDHVEHLRVDSARSSITLALDGEPTMMKPPLDFRIRKKALKVMVPA
jgi:diacylglycerol kinase family enzyme